ncbi:hypothetical protein F7725_014364, partial [Dissostichus mawsoni]
MSAAFSLSSVFFSLQYKLESLATSPHNVHDLQLQMRIYFLQHDLYGIWGCSPHYRSTAQTHFPRVGRICRENLAKIAIVLIAVGSIITVVSILGCLGAFFNNYNLVVTFLCCLIIIILMEIITGAVVYTFYIKMVLNPSALANIKGSVNYMDKLKRVISEYSPEKRAAIDRIQEKFKCCGADGPDDWATSVGWADHEATPDSCCVEKSAGCGKEKDKARKKGCIQAINLFLGKILMA